MIQMFSQFLADPLVTYAITDQGKDRRGDGRALRVWRTRSQVPQGQDRGAEGPRGGWTSGRVRISVEWVFVSTVVAAI